MPFARSSDNSQIYWKLEGSLQKPALVLLNSIGTDMALWDRTIPHLLNSFCILRLDTRGHGASTVLAGDYALAALADDVVAVMDAAGIKQAAIAGVSLGGMIAMELALRHRERVTALALICTSATIDTVSWTDRVEKVRSGGMASIVDLAMSRFLSPEFARSHEDTAESVRLGLLGMSPDGYAGAGAAIRDMALIDRLPGLDIPTLVIVGDRDSSMPLSGHADRLVATIPGATLQHLGTGHLAPLEAPNEVAKSIQRFLLQKPKTQDAADTLFEAGLANRRRILGDEWVNRSLANRTSFNTDFQAMITRIAWHEIWSRDGLDDRTRRLLVIAITVSLGRWEEFGLHVRSGLSRGGFTRDELKEVLMQTGIYAGVPAANTAFAEAGKIIAELEKASRDQAT